MEEKNKHVVDITQCPNCGSDERLADNVLKEQQKKGKVGKKTNAYLFQLNSVIAGPPGTWLSAPVIVSFYDACAECGTVYVRHSQVQTVMQGGQKLPGYPQGGGFSGTN